jgi:hypothetical protein
VVLVEGIRSRSHHSGMLTSEDHRQLAERCIRLAKTCAKPTVAEQLMTLAANYLELAERALRLQPAARNRAIETAQLRKAPSTPSGPRG